MVMFCNELQLQLANNINETLMNIKARFALWFLNVNVSLIDHQSCSLIFSLIYSLIFSLMSAIQQLRDVCVFEINGLEVFM